MTALAIGVFSPSSAAAAPSCTGQNITGRGSSLQKIAQQNVWAPGFQTSVCNKGTEPKVTYESTGSAGCISAWNFNGEKGFIDTTAQFCSSDDAPTAAQMTTAESKAGGAKVAVVPVAQTAISFVANPPVGCEVEVLTNSNLAGIMEGRIRNWSKVETAEGECNSPITRVVRKDGSGTSYQTKNYLFKLVSGTLSCTEGLVEPGKKATWQQLEPIGTESKPNILWPESCAEQELSPVVRPSGTGGGEVVKKVNATPGSIGYAALPDAMNNKTGNTRVLAIQNNGQKKAFEATFAEPASGTQANCGGIAYQVPKLNGSLDIDWSQTFGAKPAVGGESYPLCTLTYVLVWNKYSAIPTPEGGSPFTSGQETTVRDYVREYLVAPAGQTAIASDFYAPLPSSGEPLFDVLGAAQKAANNIAF